MQRQIPPGRETVAQIFDLTELMCAKSSGEYASYRYDENRQSELETEINAQGVPEIERFHARNANNQTFAIKSEPLPGSVEVLINGLIEHADIYTTEGKEITLHTKLTATDAVIVKYRRRR